MILYVALLTAAAPVVQRPSVKGDPSIEDRIDDLESEDARKRKLAAMALRRDTRQYARDADRERGDEVRIMEARQALMVFDDELASTCVAQLAVPNLTGLCADILGLLQTSAAEAPLESQLGREERGSVRRRIARALATIRAS